MGIMVRRLRFENKGHGYRMRCHFCHRPKGELYDVHFDEDSPRYLLCPGNCMKQAEKNYTEKVKKGIIPIQDIEDQSIFSEIQQESLEDNIIRE